MSNHQINIHEIIKELNVGEVESSISICNGTASFVWKVSRKCGRPLAVRMVESGQLKQCRKEQEIMQMMRAEGIPVPIVHQVKEVDRYAVMVLDWVDGKTVVQHLLERPGDAHVIGIEFGEMQAGLHRLPLNFEPSREGDWLTPETPAEEELFLRLNRADRSYLHLDYHPLNVMLSERGIIDWTNFALGDYRFDLARTLSILEIHGGQYFSEEVLHSFITGWKEGYESKRGSIGKLTSYIGWAGERMKRDLGDSMDKEVEARIDEWVHKKRGEIF